MDDTQYTNDESNYSEMFKVCGDGDWSKFQDLVNSGDDDIHQIGWNNNTCLHFASRGIIIF